MVRAVDGEEGRKGAAGSDSRGYHNSPLNMMGDVSTGSATYPVSSLSSRTAACSAVSPSSMRPAGSSITILSSGGRYCFWRTISGPVVFGWLGKTAAQKYGVSHLPVSFSKMATTPTPSISLSFGRVVRSADSHVRVTPFGSLYVFLKKLSGPSRELVIQGERRIPLISLT